MKILERIGVSSTIICLFVVMFFSTVRAEEAITRFDSNILVEPNGDLIVTETIAVISEGRQIRRGIYRDFPRKIEKGNGKTVTVAFDILSVRRNGESEDYKSENQGNSVTRIYIGNKDVFIDKGTHTYEIKYRTDRQLRFFDTHDELFWNVTGTQWVFPIRKATAIIKLPGDIKAQESVLFTGKYGSTKKNGTSQIRDGGNPIYFETTKPLDVYSGLTIGIKMPKGSFEPVPSGKGLIWFWQDFKAETLALVTLIISSAFYFVRWWKFGRDPEAGVIVPQWRTPDKLSPALVNYVDEKGFGTHAWKGLTAALLNLAVKGYVILGDLDSKPIISRTKKQVTKDIPVGEAALLERLDSYKSRSIKLNKTNGSKISTMHSKFKSAMEDEHRNSYYHKNWGSIILGVLISVIGIFMTLISGGANGSIIAMVFPFSIAAVAITLLSVKLGKTIRGNGSLAEKIVASVFLAGTAFVTLSGIVAGLSNFISYISQPLLIIAVLGIVMVNALFFFLLGAPTSLGRDTMDVMAGMKTYLELAEKDRMNLSGAPEMSPQHFETLLPYAVAMGVEKPWSDSFQTWLLTASAVGAGAAMSHYSPGWTRGNFDSDRISDTFGEVASNMESQFTAALPTPKSSSSGFSSGGGGFSGGGGGGGGGGGW